MDEDEGEEVCRSVVGSVVLASVEETTEVVCVDSLVVSSAGVVWEVEAVVLMLVVEVPKLEETLSVEVSDVDAEVVEA